MSFLVQGKLRAELSRTIGVNVQGQTTKTLGPKYEALSYTWASELPSVKANVSNGALSGRSVFDEIELGGNLASALKHLRYMDKSRVL